MCTPTTSARSLAVGAAPRPRCARSSPASAAAASASTWWTPTSSAAMDLVVGRVVKAHGITGEVVVEVRTDDPDARFAAGKSLRGKQGRGGTEREFVVDAVREHSGRLLVRLSGVASRDAADALRGTLFLVDVAELPPIDDPDEFYDHQLEGLTVR